jgi:Uma2 family endonuclease
MLGCFKLLNKKIPLLIFVQILSLSYALVPNSLKPLQEKMREYIENGAKLGWLIDPQQRRVEIYQPAQDVEILDQPSELLGENVLVGFVLNLQRVWE